VVRGDADFIEQRTASKQSVELHGDVTLAFARLIEAAHPRAPK